jgi:hypothetical protein
LQLLHSSPGLLIEQVDTEARHPIITAQSHSTELGRHTARCRCLARPRQPTENNEATSSSPMDPAHHERIMSAVVRAASRS